MKEEYLIYPAQFFTATIYEWKTMLANEKHKEIIIDSLHFLVNKKRIELNPLLWRKFAAELFFISVLVPLNTNYNLIQLILSFHKSPLHCYTSNPQVLPHALAQVCSRAFFLLAYLCH